jgi:hypothetical protein
MKRRHTRTNTTECGARRSAPQFPAVTDPAVTMTPSDMTPPDMTPPDMTPSSMPPPVLPYRFRFPPASAR